MLIGAAAPVAAITWVSHLIVLLIGLGLGVGCFYSYSHWTCRTPAAKEAATPSKPFDAAQNVERMRHLQEVRAQAMAAHPELLADFQSLSRDIQENETATEAAMVKEDPKVAPILAKLHHIQASNSVPTSH